MISCIENLYRHGSLRLPWRTFFLLLIGLAVYVFGGPAPEGLVFDRQAIDQGEFWRLLTAHWIHADLEHLAFNLVAFGILAWMIESSLGHVKLYAALIIGMCFVDVGVWWFVPDIDYYCGLSGILNTLLFVVLVDGWRQSRNVVFVLVAVGTVFKIAVELVQESAIFTSTSWPAVPEAHLAGALAAAVVALSYRFSNLGRLVVAPGPNQGFWK
ncbi:MAG: rhombosortase [Gammaproteobacteria bacterium]|nr:rhombosortase [Gammaproteobacteria bacterium]